jgi:hypothetical protein
MGRILAWVDGAAGHILPFTARLLHGIEGLSRGQALTLTVLLPVPLALLLLWWRDWALQKQVLWVLDQKLSYQVGQEYREMERRNMVAVGEVEARLLGLQERVQTLSEQTERDMQASFLAVRDDILLGRFPVQILVRSNDDREALAALLSSSVTQVLRETYARYRVAEPERAGRIPVANAYALVLDDEPTIEPEPEQEEPCPPKTRKRSTKRKTT